MELIGKIEEFGNCVKPVHNARRCDDNLREIALAGTEELPQISLFGFRRQPCRGPAALDVNDDEGNLHHSCAADGFCHEGESAARGSAHRAAPGVRGTNRHVDDADFVFALPHHDA